jgi:hypothetical protein
MTRSPDVYGGVTLAGQVIGLQQPGADGFAEQTTIPLLVIRVYPCSSVFKLLKPL